MGVTVFEVSGAMTLNSVKLNSGNINPSGTKKYILDGDEDTYITSGADDDISIYISGSEDFSFEADKFVVETGSEIQAASAIVVSGPGFIPNAAQSSNSGPGAISNVVYYTTMTTTGADAFTLADADVKGQIKKIQMIVDAGDGTLTPANLSGGTTITFADVGDTCELLWNGSSWTVLALYNVVDGATAPVLA